MDPRVPAGGGCRACVAPRGHRGYSFDVGRSHLSFLVPVYPGEG
jgi:hypothetical protein